MPMYRFPLVFWRRSICPKCGGWGFYALAVCPRCKGTGLARRWRRER